MRWRAPADMSMGTFFRRGPSCTEVLEQLQAYLDGEIEAGPARRIASHLQRCDSCEGESLVFVQIKVSLTRVRREVDTEVLDALAKYGSRLMQNEFDQA